MEEYRNRKLLERYLEPASFKYGMSMPELYLLLYLKDGERILSRKKLADLTNLSAGSLTVAIQKLSAKKMAASREEPRKKGEERKLRISVLPAAEPVLADLVRAEQDFCQGKFQDFSDEELHQYRVLEEKIKRNILRVLH